MLGRDGTSRFVTYFSNYMSKQDNVDVTLLFFRDVEPQFLQQIEEKTNIICLSVKGKLWKEFYKIVKAIISTRPNICILGFHQLVFMSLLSPILNLYGIRLIIRDTIIPSLYHKNTNWTKRILLKICYKNFYSIIVQSQDMRDDLVKNWGVSLQKTILINNPVDTKKLSNMTYTCPKEMQDKEQFIFVAAGRLSYQKGYDIIINRISEMKDVPFKLYILGSGELEDELRDLIISKNVNDTVFLVGYRKDVASYLYHADALLLSSRYEGFPNIVLEALSLGKPVLANNCPGGINEIIINGNNGWICNFEDAISFNKGLKHFISTQFNSDVIKQITADRFDINIIMERYAEVLSAI